MALISKMNRCAVCGSSEVVYDKASGMYHCPTCGEEIVVDEDVLAKGGMKCPACGEELDFDLSQVLEDLTQEDGEAEE